MKRFKDVKGKKRFVLAIAAVIYQRTGKYSTTYRSLQLCLVEKMWYRISENWIRTRLKRLGIGMSKRHYGETLDDCNGWVATRLNQVAYGCFGPTVIYSHHHRGGSAFEAVEEKCPHCGSEIPANLRTLSKLLELRRKAT